MTTLRQALINLLRSDVIHMWPPEQVVDVYLLPMIDDAVEELARRRYWGLSESTKVDPKVTRRDIDEANRRADEEGVWS